MITVNSEEDIRFHTPYIWPHDQATLLSLSSPYLISITFNLRWQTVTRVHYNLNTCKYPGIRSTKYITLTLPLRTAMKPQIIREYQIECIVSVPKQILLKTFLYWYLLLGHCWIIACLFEITNINISMYNFLSADKTLDFSTGTRSSFLAQLS